MKTTRSTDMADANFITRMPAGFSLFFKGLLLIFLLLIIGGNKAKAQDKYRDENEIYNPVYDQIPVHIVIEGVGSFYLNVIYNNKGLLYVNFEDLFRLLQIPCIPGQDGDELGGVIGNESQAYLVGYESGLLKYGNKIINTGNGLIRETGTLYMESSLFAEAFGIVLTFNFRALTLTLKSDFELPVIKQQRLEKIRNNITRVKGEVTADTVVKRNYHFLKFGTLDWSAASFQVWNGLTDNRLGLGVGTELLYGEVDVSVFYYNRQKFDNRQLQYLWRWVDNDKKLVKQAQVGKISTQTISFINAPLVGAMVRNSPTTVRKATGYYTINEYTEPNWNVELYINNILVDHTRADASGLFVFKVPVVYGYTSLKLKFYGPLGEERTVERSMNVPYSMMPVNEFEYGLSGGMVQDSSRSRFGRGEFNYGLSRKLTVGGGMEYLSSILDSPFIPFAKATLQPFSKLTLNGEYAYGVRTRGILSYYFGRSALLEIDYAKYTEGQHATIFNADEERKVKLSVPFRFKKICGFAKLDYTQLIYKDFFYNQGNIMLSAYYRQFSANSSVQLNWIDRRTPYITMDLALSYRLGNGFTFRPSAQYNVNEGRFIMGKAEIEKRVAKAYFSVIYQENISYNDQYISINFRYDLPFARTAVSASSSNGKVITSESAQGSLAFGSGKNFVYGSNNSSVSKGGISLYPFLDLNRNGIFDTDEHLLKLSTVRVSGKAIFSEKDSIVRIPDLNAFTSYRVEFSNSDLGNISWQFKNKSCQVMIDPNQFKRVDVPVIALGEVSGMASLDKDGFLKGIGRILVKILNRESLKVVAETLSESDGYIYYLGLEPGDYLVLVDTAQLRNLGFTADPPQIPFIIKTTEEGDMVGGIDFVLRQEIKAPPDKQKSVHEPIAVVSENDLINLQVQTPHREQRVQQIAVPVLTAMSAPAPWSLPAERILFAEDTRVYLAGDTLYKIQLLALNVPIRAKGYFDKLLADVPGITIEELEAEDGLYHYSTGAFRGIAEARVLMEIITQSGWHDCFITAYTAGIRAGHMHQNIDIPVNKSTNSKSK